MFIDEYLDWFHHVTGRVISLATMCRTIIRLGFTHKKVYTLSAVYFLLAKNQENEKLTFRNNWQIRHVYDVTAHARPGYIACRKTTSKDGCRKISAMHVTLKRAVSTEGFKHLAFGGWWADSWKGSLPWFTEFVSVGMNLMYNVPSFSSKRGHVTEKHVLTGCKHHMFGSQTFEV